MPAYRLRYVCETSLQSDADVSLEHRGTKILLLFSKAKPAKNAVHVVLEMEAATYRDADVKAQSVLQPAIDAIAFTTGSPLRYALQRTVDLDRFVFQWLAFEGLSGKKQIPTICPRCQSEVTHCDQSLSHEGSDAGRAYELFSRIDSAVTARQFKQDIWGRARNAVFHGTKYPAPEFRLGLRSLFPKLRQACNAEFNRRYNFGDDPRPAQGLELHVYKTIMFEWRTADAEIAFADDFPWENLRKEFANVRLGEVRARPPESPLTLLDFNRESPNW